MRNRDIVIHGISDIEQSLFNPHARDNCCEPFIILKQEIEKLGYSLKGSKNRSSNSFIDLYWNYFPPSKKIKLKRFVKTLFKPKAQSVLILWEGKASWPLNFSINSYKRFSKVMTWDDDLVDGKIFHKFLLPSSQNVPHVSETAFSDKKLLVNISYNKLSDTPSELYSERRNSIRYFEKNQPRDFDLYGYGWNSNDYPSYRGPIQHKWQILPKYKFAICYENSCGQPGQITEKIFDCLRADCVPIYWGAPNINDYVDTGCFIDRGLFNSNAELEKYIISVSEAEYQRFRYLKEKYLQSDKFKQFLSPAFAKRFIEILNLRSDKH